MEGDAAAEHKAARGGSGGARSRHRAVAGGGGACRAAARGAGASAAALGQRNCMAARSAPRMRGRRGEERVV
jgi:hypothetical protein